MRILLICEGLEGTDGWSRYSANLRQALLAKGHIVMMCTHKKNGEDYAILPPPLRMMTRPYLGWFLAMHLKRIVQKEHVDVVHFTVEPYALCMAFLPASIRKRSVVTIHGNYGIRPLRWWASKWLAQAMLQHVHQCIAVSTFTRDAVAKEVFWNHNLHEAFLKKTHVVHNGIPLPPYTPRMTYSPVHQILFVGGVKISKGILEAIRGCAAYKKQFGSTFHFSIAGAIDEASTSATALRSLIAESELQEETSILGRVDDATLEQLYEKADILLMPSLTTQDTFEGFGLVYIEANAHGVPVIGPDRSGSTEAIANGKSGYTVDVKNPEAIADALHKILDKHTISPDGCRQWAESFSVDHMTNATIDSYDKARCAS
ncbi:glycosyltransferase family 4 protein [Candidatus Peribacteria bacterium]|nr:glycosyltransferase family 4 protein [Candidatus Peribacteria bacterium]